MSQHIYETCGCSACVFLRNPHRYPDGTINLVLAREMYSDLHEAGSQSSLVVLTLALATHPNDPAGVLAFLKQNGREILAPWDPNPWAEKE